MHQLVIYQAIKDIAKGILEAKRVVVFTGAGASTESGIPDFRSPGGIWTKFDPEDFTIYKFLSSAETRKKQWRILVESGLLSKAEPNRAHLAIAGLEKMGKLDCVITQNIDNLHQKAGNSPDIVFELHGNMNRAKCLACGAVYPMEQALKQLDKGDEPLCESCDGMLKPDVVFFGESLPAAVLYEAARRSRNCDFFIVIGSSLAVYPAAYMPSYAKEAGARLAIINASTTAYDLHADILVNSGAGDVMEKIMGILKEGL
jgi:NAD-dependent deacetylase